MENKCFSCEITVPKLHKDENADTFGYITELITYCVPEMENTDYDLPVNFCENCVELLEGYTKFKRKCLDWQEQLEHFQEERPILYEVDDAFEDEAKTEPVDADLDADVDEDTQEETVIIEFVNEDEDMLDDPEEEEDEVAAATTTSEVETTEGNRYKCPKCKSTLKTKKLLSRHIKVIHETERELECPICNLKFKTKFSLASHSLTHEDARPHICQFCGKSFKHKRVMHLHEVRHGDVRAFKCAKWPECKSTFKTKDEANTHLSSHALGKRFVCPVCNVKFKTKFTLASHARVHDETIPQHVCKICGNGYKTRYNLVQHEALHVNRREFKCEAADCPKAFNTKNELTKHTKAAHTSPSEWKYQCEYCDWRFPQKSTFKRHVQTHTNERPFECHLCEYKTFTKRELKKHLNAHEGIKEFKCFRCSAGYRHKYTLQTHLWEKHQIGVGCNDDDLPIKLVERNFHCLHCDKKYPDSLWLRNHMKTNHPDMVDNDNIKND